MIQTHMATPNVSTSSTPSQPAFNVSNAQSDGSDAAHQPMAFSVVSTKQHAQMSGNAQLSESGPTTAAHLLGEAAPQIGPSALLTTIADDEQDTDSNQPSTDTTPLAGAAAVLAELMSTQMHTQENSGSSASTTASHIGGVTSEMSQIRMKVQGTTPQKVQSTQALTEMSPHTSVTLSQAEKSALKPAALSPDIHPPLSSTAQLLSTLNSPQHTATQNTQVASGPATAATAGAEWASVRVDPQSGKWGEQMLSILHDRVTLQAQQHVQEAKIRLDPPDLGKLDLFVRVEGDRLSVQIHANTVATREALIQVSDRLRAELQDQNFVHVDVNVGSEQSGERGQTTSDDNEATIFAARGDQQDTRRMTFTSEHWLSTKA